MLTRHFHADLNRLTRELVNDLQWLKISNSNAMMMMLVSTTLQLMAAVAAVES